MSENVEVPGYRIHSVLGYGGMSTVYVAEQKSLGRQVALKIMAQALSSDPTYTKRFLKEARIIAHLNHPHIIVIYDYGVVGAQHYIAMEYVTGGDLFQRIKQEMRIRDILDVLVQVSKALNFAHSKGYIHRDIKPGNILFRDDGAVVLSDFGLAKGLSDSTQVTAAGMTMGTPAYMSPEQAFGENVDARSDLYSLGCVLYFMLTGEKPYTAENPVALAMKHLRDPIPKLSQRHAWLQPALEKFLAKNPDDRFQSGNEVIDAVEKLFDEESATPIKQSSLGGGREAAPADPGVVEFSFAPNDVISMTDMPSREEIESILGVKATSGASGVPQVHGGTDLGEARKDSTFEQVQDYRDRHRRTPDQAVDPMTLLKGVDAQLAVERFRESTREQVVVPRLSAEPSVRSATPPMPPPQVVQAEKKPRAGAWIGAFSVAIVVSTLANVGFTMYLAQQQKFVPATTEAEEIAQYEQQRWTQPAKPMVRFTDPLTNGGQGPEMVVVPAGQFEMGDKSNRYGASARPVRQLAISKSFAISAHEITFEQYEQFAGATGREAPPDRGWGRGRRPVIYVSWEDARAYVDWLAQATGRRYRLPSEAEWEYAARGNSAQDFWWGDRASHQFANFGSDVCCRGLAEGIDQWADATAEVGAFPANGFGVYDTAGNVWEWVMDCWNPDYYEAGPNTGARTNGDCAKRVVRGGSWSDIPIHTASAARGRAAVDSKLSFIGFRVIRED